ncbi:MAG: hypothetical protein JXB49_29835 [Bacteroidales bacterium]|nr:hypothetical protein [Bacteroidales bacterium]
MTINDIQTGDTFLVKRKAFLSKMICKVMKRWGKKNGKDTSRIYSHAARFIWCFGDLYLYGSVENGYNPISFKKHYDFNNDDFAIMRRNTPLTEAEKDQTARYCLHLDTVSLSYQYWNFIQWLLKVYLKINLFKKDSEKFTYCYEAERLARKNLNPDNYANVYITDIYELLYDPNYHTEYFSKP